MSAPQPSGGYQNQNGYGQVAATAPSYPTDNYQFCYGQLGAQGTQTKFGPYLYINFEPLPAGTIEFIEFEATYPSNITWQIWRQQPTGKFAVVYEKSTTFQTGKHSVQVMNLMQEIKFVKNFNIIIYLNCGFVIFFRKISANGPCFSYLY